MKQEKKSYRVSFVIPVYNEEKSLEKLYGEIGRSIEQSRREEHDWEISEYEVFFINDGSVDSSEEVIKEMIAADSRIRLISFRKNFGKAAALEAGFRHCAGDIIFTMDADLQDDPAEISRFIDKLEEGYDLVSGWKYNRKDPLEKRLPSKLFNWVTARASGVELHDFNCGFKAYRREVVKGIDVYGEFHRYIPVFAQRKGFKIAEITVHHNKREFGKSKYGFERYTRGLLDSISSVFLLKYYDKPMYFFGKWGIISLLIGVILCGYLTVEWLLGDYIGTRPLLQLGILCIITGIQLFSIGFIGNLIVDTFYRSRYSEEHIKEII
ncbi:MAG: glycosyltransferase family 2 protein [Lachnospiraceae bacterium]|nr:glycosyltransferase family 2 protein [Lachnospiraceae bacterium]